jgi:hypothetical protein
MSAHAAQVAVAAEPWPIAFLVLLLGEQTDMLAWWSRRFVRRAFALVVLPLAAWSLAWGADQLAQRRGESRLTALLRSPQRYLSDHLAAK